MSQRALPSILVVEDDLDLRQTIVASLESNGFAAAQAADAADAIERLRSFAYDGLVVDLRLPDADGMTVLDEALDRYPEIRAVVMTGFGGVAEAVAAIKRGAVDFLIKPFQLSQIARGLRPKAVHFLTLACDCPADADAGSGASAITRSIDHDSTTPAYDNTAKTVTSGRAARILSLWETSRDASWDN